MTHEYPCPYCGVSNLVHENVWKNVALAVPASIATALGAKAIKSHNIGMGLVYEGMVLGASAIVYLNGKKITCGNCGEHFLAF